MKDALLPEFLIALFAGGVAFAIMRRNTPRVVEALLWVGLVWVCVLGVTSIHDKQARDLTSAAFWGTTQVFGSVFTLSLLGVKQWMVENRFLIADWAVLAAGVDLLALAYLASRRQAAGWQPRVRLRDWMELPPLSAPRPALVTESATDEINKRFNVWAPVAAAAALTWTTLFLIWTGDVAAPAMGRRLRTLANSRGGPRQLTEKVVDIADVSRRAAYMRERASGWLNEAGKTPEAHWRGFGVGPAQSPDGGNDTHGTQRDRKDRLAS